MSTLSANPRPRTTRSLALPRLREMVAIALVAAAVGYVLHHLPPLSDHLVAGVAIVVFAAGAVALGLGALSAERRASALPTVIVPPPGGIEVRPLQQQDLDFCAALHADALNHGFFVRFGPRFIRSYLAAFLDSPHAVAFAATAGGEPVGWLVGSLDARAHVRWVIRHRGVVLGLQGAAAMALHPGAGLRFLRTRVRRYAGAWRRHRRADAPREDERGAPAAALNEDERGAPAAVLNHVAVLPGARGLGAGRRLVRAFEDEARRQGAPRAFLTTLEGPDGAASFYASLGWQRSGLQVTPEGRSMEEWTLDLRGGGA